MYLTIFVFINNRPKLIYFERKNGKSKTAFRIYPDRVNYSDLVYTASIGSHQIWHKIRDQNATKKRPFFETIQYDYCL